MRILTTCSAIKRVAPHRDLLARHLGRGTLGAVADDWIRRLSSATADTPACALYGGRGFGHAYLAAGGRPWTVSAGLGLLHPLVAVPSYGATVSGGSEDDVFRRIEGPRDPGGWWAALKHSPYASPIADLFDGDGPVLAALSASYLSMLADDLAALADADLGRLRIFTASAPAVVDARIRHLVMPCGGTDEIGAYRGVIADYAQRALRHFAETILPHAPEGDLEEHCAMMSGTHRPSSGPSPR